MPTGGIGGTGLVDNGVGGTGLKENGVGGTGLTQNGVGGTGRAPEGPSGIGGTGLAQNGVGGTGLRDLGTVGANGVGGTGIVGVVTAFGSIWVNGVEVALDSNTVVDGKAGGIGGTGLAQNGVGGTGLTQNGVGGTGRAPAGPSGIGGTGLAVGQTVAVQAESRAGSARAATVRSLPVLEGPVQAVGADGTLTIMGQQVRTGNLMGGAGSVRPAVGESVRVFGLVHQGGVIEATQLAAGSGGGSARVAGRLQPNGDGFTIGGVRIQLPPALQSRAAAGMSVVAEGSWDGTALQATALAPDPVEELLDHVAQVSLQGYLASNAAESALQVGFARLPVRTASQPSQSGAAAQDQLVVVTGTVNPDRTVTATAIRPLATPQAAVTPAPSANQNAQGTAPQRPGTLDVPGKAMGGPPASPPRGPPQGVPAGGGPPCGTPPCGKGNGGVPGGGKGHNK